MVTEKEYQEIKNRPSDIPRINRMIEKSRIKCRNIIKESEKELRRILCI